MATQENAQQALQRNVQKTYQVKKSTAQRDWHVVDVSGKVLGRAASQIAHILRGKHKPSFTANVDNGDFVVVVNADKIVLTGNKLQDKSYYRHSHFPGGLRETTASEMLASKPEELLRFAVKGMLPRGPLGRQLFKKLKVYAASEHPHTAQQPKPHTL